MAEVTVTDNKKIYFDIIKHTSAECLTAINTLTNGCFSQKVVEDFAKKVDFFSKMTELITKRNHAWYGSIDAPTEVDLLKHVIGKGGARLKQITVKYGAYIIWHDRAENKFIVWGAKMALISTLHALLRHISKCTVKQAELKQDLATMEESMTVLTLPVQEAIRVQETTTVHRERDEDMDEIVEPMAKKLKATF